MTYVPPNLAPYLGSAPYPYQLLLDALFEEEEEEGTETYHVDTIDDVLVDLRNMKLDVLKTDPFLDPYKLFIRGGVTRIGGYSNMGKSTFTYFVADKLLDNGYRGLIFSTEVVRSIVLAQLERIHSGKSVFDICQGKVYDEDAMRNRFANLVIYDGTRTGNEITVTTELIKAHLQSQKVDFVILDYIQGLRPEEKCEGIYDRMTSLAFSIQSLAQSLNIAVIDVSQVSNESLDGTKNQRGADFVGLKGSGDLFAAAEVVLNIWRDKSKENSSEPVKDVIFKIAKHKYAPTGEINARVDFSTGKIWEGADIIVRSRM